MKVVFWGTRGSLPSSFTARDVRAKVTRALELARGQDLRTAEALTAFVDQLPFSVRGTFGTSTPCVQLANPGGDYVFCDAGSGLRDFALQYMRQGLGVRPATFHIFVNHLHWDHVQGFPFFTPIYLPGNRIILHGHHETIPEMFRRQMSPPGFPVPFEILPSKIEFDIQPLGHVFEVGGFRVTSMQQNHPGLSYGYRFEKAGRVIVYATDCEHKEDAFSENYPFLSFFDSADLLIFDAMYTLADATFSKADWGHSSNIMGFELAARARVKHLCLFHNDPAASDAELEQFLAATRMYGSVFHSDSKPPFAHGKFPLQVSLAHDGLEIDL